MGYLDSLNRDNPPPFSDLLANLGLTASLSINQAYSETSENPIYGEFTNYRPLIRTSEYTTNWTVAHWTQWLKDNDLLSSAGAYIRWTALESISEVSALALTPVYVQILYEMLKVFPTGAGPGYTYSDIDTLQKSYFGRLSTISLLSQDPMLNFIRELKRYQLYLVELSDWKKTYEITVFAKSVTGPKVYNNAKFRALYNIPYFSGPAFLGYSEENSLSYINAIESLFSEDMITRAVNHFRSMQHHSDVWDEKTVIKLFSNDLNFIQGIDNVINASIPVKVINSQGAYIAQRNLSIPDKMKNPVDGSTYYPKRRLKEIYEKAMSVAALRVWDTIGAQAAKVTTPEYVPTPSDIEAISDPARNPFLVVDPIASEKEGKLVYIDMSDNQIVQYNKGGTYTYGSAQDVAAYLKALEMGSEVIRYPSTTGMAFSEQDMLRMGVPKESALKKFLPLAILAAAGAALAAKG